MVSISKLKNNILQTIVMKNIRSKTICSKRTPYFVIFMVQNERQIRGKMLCKSFYCFYDNKKIVLICLTGWHKFIVLLQIIDLVENQ